MSSGTAVGRTRVPLLDPRWRPLAWVTIVAATAVFLGLALEIHDTRTPTAFDSDVAAWLSRRGGVTGQQLLLVLSEPALTVGFLVVVTLCAVLLRRWDLAVFAAVGPSCAQLLSSVILKPIVHRQLGFHDPMRPGLITYNFAFPSGHETALTSAMVVVAMLLLRSSLTRQPKMIVVVLAAAWLVLGAAGLVRAGYHYGTDTIGGFCVALVAVVATALVVDAVTARVYRRGGLSSPDAGNPSRTPRAT